MFVSLINVTTLFQKYSHHMVVVTIMLYMLKVSIIDT